MGTPRRNAGAHPGIYVQVPAYRDTELPRTLLDLYAKASRPERLRVRVMWQHGRRERLPESVRSLPNLEIAAVPYRASRGCNWARHELQRQWNGEPFTLLLDSHHRFVRGWDGAAVRMQRKLQEDGTAKPILTAYLPAYQPSFDPAGRKRQPYRIYPLGRERGVLTKLTSFPIQGWKSLTRPVPADFASLHFLFAPGAFNEEIRFDPEIYFFGDEVVTSVRAYTHGYDLFHPHVVLGWHSFDRASRVPHWKDHDGWRSQHDRSLEIMRRLFRGTYQGPFGVGPSRSVREYEEHVLLTLAEEPGEETRALG
jgi:Glycosyltransferase (GlcNAc)